MGGYFPSPRFCGGNGRFSTVGQHDGFLGASPLALMTSPRLVFPAGCLFEFFGPIVGSLCYWACNILSGT
jgi:hypothetical protein